MPGKWSVQIEGLHKTQPHFWLTHSKPYLLISHSALPVQDSRATILIISMEKQTKTPPNHVSLECCFYFNSKCIKEYLLFLARQWSFAQSKKQNPNSLLTLSPHNIKIIIVSQCKGIKNQRFEHMPGCLATPFGSNHLNKFIINNFNNNFFPLLSSYLASRKIQHPFLSTDSSSF